MKTQIKNPRFRKYLVSYLILVALVFSGAFYAFYLNQADAFGDAEKQLIQAAGSKIQQINNWKKERIAEGQFLFKNGSFNSSAYKLFYGNGGRFNEEELKNWVEPIKSNHLYRDYVFAGLTGKVFLSSSPDAETRYRNVLSYTDSVRISEKIFFTHLENNPVTGKLEFYSVIPLKIRTPEKEELFGIFFWVIDPAPELYNLIFAENYFSKLSTDAVLFRVTQDSIFFLSSIVKKDHYEFKKVSLGNDELAAVKAVKGGDGIYSGLDYNGRNVLAAVYKISSLNLYLAYKFESSEIWGSVIGNTIFAFAAILSLLGGFGFYLGYLLTNDERKNIKKTLELETQRLEMVKRFGVVFESSDEIMMILDAEGRIMNINQAGIRKYGRPYNNETYFLLTGEQIKREMDGLSVPEGKYETIHTTHEDEEFEAEVSVQNLSGSGDNIVFVIVRELTEKAKLLNEIKNLNINLEKKVEKRTEELQLVNKELESFTYSVSHDLRAPLRHISGFIELFSKKYKTKLDEGGLRYLSIISESAIDMGKLIDKLLIFSRITRTELVKEKTDLNKLVAEAFGVCAADIKENRIEFVSETLPEIFADREMIRLVLTNLFSNAIKYSSKKSVIRIEVGYSDLGNEIVIFVKDNGAGFDMKYYDKLFKVFQRLHTADEFEGTGIGLANVERIIRKHGGRVWAESVLKQGSVFYFSVPVLN